MGQRTELIDSAIANSPIRRGKREEVMNANSIADNFPVAADMPPVLFLHATAARDVLMPADSAAIKGLKFCIINTSVTAGATLTLKTSADAALTPAVAVTVNTAVTMVHGGGTGLSGWRRAEGL